MSLLMVCCTKDDEAKAATVQMAGKHVALIVSSHSSGISGVVADAERLVKNVTWMGDALWINPRINDYTFFDYDQREALHLSEREQRMVVELFDRIEEELQHPIDKHSQTLITDAIGLLLDYCMRYYDRQFITRHKVNSDILTAFHQQLREYFVSGHPERNGLPTVAYFADKACLSPNYFGDLISKESGTTAQRHIQDAVIERSKQLLVETRLPVSEIAYLLGFEYPQHFSRLFKSRTGKTPNEYRLTA